VVVEITGANLQLDSDVIGRRIGCAELVE